MALHSLSIDRFPMTHFIDPSLTIIIIDMVSVELLCKLAEMTRTCLTGHTGSIHVNALGGRHTCILTSWTKALVIQGPFTQMPSGVATHRYSHHRNQAT